MHDEGTIGDSLVINVEKVGGVVIHQLAKANKKFEKNATVQIKINKDRRLALMRHHTATHVVNGAAKRILGNHIWQAGAEKKPDVARLDITHYKAITQEELWAIERLANQVVMETRPVDIQFMPRGDAERKYGFTLYQGGIVPGKEIRVIDIQDWDVEACGGTHLKNTGEIGPIKILNAKRIQDGIVRLTYAAGIAGVNAIQEQEKLLKDTARIFSIGDGEVPKTAERFFNEWKQFRREKNRLRNQLANIEKLHLLENAIVKKNLKFIIDFFVEKSIEDLIELGSTLINEDPSVIAILGGLNDKISIVILVGKEGLEAGIHAGNLVRDLTKEIGGGGGGKPELGQGGGIPKLELQKFKEIIFKEIILN